MPFFALPWTTRLLVTFLVATNIIEAHPGTWDGEIIMNENGAPYPDLTGEWRLEQVKSNNFFLKLYQPLNSNAAPPNSTYAVLSFRSNGSLSRREFEFHGVCKLTAFYDYESRNRTSTEIFCKQDESNSSGVVTTMFSSSFFWDTIGFIETKTGKRNETDFENNKVNIAFSKYENNYLLKKAPIDKSAMFGRFYTEGPGKSEIKKAHVIFMNHYDVGYTDFINGVDNKYMHQYYALAEKTADEMDNSTSTKDHFIYTTHPWLLYRFFSCKCDADDEHCMNNSLTQNLNNHFEPPLSCPNETEIQNLELALAKEHIVWNYAPFNIQAENFSPQMFEYGFKFSQMYDEKFKRNNGTGEIKSTNTMSIRDVMYVTKNVLPFLKMSGNKYLTIGSNGAGVPPSVPKLHNWNGIIVAYHPLGYGGYGLKDCAESPNGIALCTEFRTDNTGPPNNSTEVENVLNSVRKNYPDAEVIASTFDDFFAEVETVKDQLPEVDLEAGDTWMYGVSADPLKMRQHRAIQRAWIEGCYEKSTELCGNFSHPTVQNFTFYLMKAPEHTWGTPGISGWGGGNEYNKTVFYQNYTSTGNDKYSNESYMRASASWAEQRVFNELAVKAFEEASENEPKFKPIALSLRKVISSVTEVPIVSESYLVSHGYQKLENLKNEVELKDQLGNSAILKFCEYGSFTGIRFENSCEKSINFGESGFGSISYQIFNDTEWKPFTYAYMNDHQMQKGFSKPGSNNYSESNVFRPSLKAMYIWKDKNSLILEMDFPAKPYTLYGCPKKAWLNVTLAQKNSLNLEYIIEDKVPSMIGESISINFPKQDENTISDEKDSISHYSWALPKLGGYVDPEGVIDGGNQFNHAIWGQIMAENQKGDTIKINSLDVAVVNPIIKDKFGMPFNAIGNPLPATYNETDAKNGKGLSQLPKGSVQGMSVNVQNNLWNTNYPLFYPYYDDRYCTNGVLSCIDKNMIARFELSFEQNKSNLDDVELDMVEIIVV